MKRVRIGRKEGKRRGEKGRGTAECMKDLRFGQAGVIWFARVGLLSISGRLVHMI